MHMLMYMHLFPLGPPCFQVSIIWVAASFIVQGIEGGGVSPPVLTLIANSLFSLYLPVYLLNLRLQRARAAKVAAAAGGEAGDSRSSGTAAERAALYPPTHLRSDAVGAADAAGPAPGSPGTNLEAPTTPEAMVTGDSKLDRQDMTRQQLLRAALIVSLAGGVAVRCWQRQSPLCLQCLPSLKSPPSLASARSACRAPGSRQVAPLWYLAQLTFNASLEATSVTSNTIISSTSALFTFIFSVWLLSEAFTLRKLACIALLIAGGPWRVPLSVACAPMLRDACSVRPWPVWWQRFTVAPPILLAPLPPPPPKGTAMVTVADSRASDSAEAAKRSVLGDALCLLSAIIYGGYTGVWCAPPDSMPWPGNV